MAFISFAKSRTVLTNMFNLRHISASNMIGYMPFLQSVSTFLHKINGRSSEFDVGEIKEQSETFWDDFRRRRDLVSSFAIQLILSSF